jgi:hypothetical protein
VQESTSSQGRDNILFALRAKYPDWYIWYVTPADDCILWLAGRPSSLVPAYEALTPDELDRDLSADVIGGVT